MKKNNVHSPLPKKSRLLKTCCANHNSDRIPLISHEKWEQIFCKLNQKDVSQARLVCPNWRTIIDNLYKFSITIRERRFEEIPVPFKVKTCFIYRLRKNADKIFEYPHNVQNLRILDKVKLSTLRNIFKETSNLKYLNFENSHDIEETRMCMPEEPVHFQSLLQLKIYHDKGYYLWDPGYAHIINIQRLFSYEMPLLTRLDVTIIENWNRFDEILPRFFKFFAKHSKTIKQLRASFIPDVFPSDNGATPVISEEIFNEMQPQNIMRLLHDPAFQLTTLIIAPTTRYFRLWERIINNKKKLITFYTERIEDKFVDSFCNVPINKFQPTLVRNASTLVNLHLTHLTLTRNQNPDDGIPQCFPIDGLVFENFNKLRRLILRRSMDDSLDHRGIQFNETTFVNLSSIPLELLEVLEIGWLVCETSELERLVENAKRLKIVIFHFTGYFDGKGATTEIIDNLAKKSDIHIVDVIPLNLPPDETEAQEKLAKLKMEYPQAIQIPNGQNYHYYFNFDRFRKGLFQETYYTHYRHPVYFE